MFVTIAKYTQDLFQPSVSLLPTHCPKSVFLSQGLILVPRRHVARSGDTFCVTLEGGAAGISWLETKGCCSAWIPPQQTMTQGGGDRTQHHPKGLLGGQEEQKEEPM